jgi:rSAM/selenodomain-associated transferase 2/rSAM/selenodomain-associated transferase 1
VKLGIVLPVLSEGMALLPNLQTLAPLRERGAWVAVVFGGAHDDLPQGTEDWVDAVLSAPRGRAAQMNAGACAARDVGADALLFLHADTALPHDADALIEAAFTGGADWGRFDVRIEGRHLLLPMVAALMNRRSRLTGIATGDQALFMRRRVFEAVGGFAALPLMEDIELCRRLKALSAPACLAPRVTTSGRRWDEQGLWRTVWLMWRLRAAWLGGADPYVLAQRYGYAPREPAAVAVMAKAPVPGLAKTRLMPLLGAVGAARAHRELTLRTLASVRGASTGPITLWCAPDVEHHFFAVLRQRHGVVCASQPAGDLGQRLCVAMNHHFASTPKTPWLVVGTDCPVLTASHLQQAADALRRYDAVLIPAQDGGYVLLGLRRPMPGVFESVDWSTPKVLAQTRDRLRAAGATWLELPALWDVDEPSDWLLWRSQALSAEEALIHPGAR